MIVFKIEDFPEYEEFMGIGTVIKRDSTVATCKFQKDGNDYEAKVHLVIMYSQFNSDEVQGGFKVLNLEVLPIFVKRNGDRVIGKDFNKLVTFVRSTIKIV